MALQPPDIMNNARVSTENLAPTWGPYTVPRPQNRPSFGCIFFWWVLSGAERLMVGREEQSTILDMLDDAPRRPSPASRRWSQRRSAVVALGLFLLLCQVCAATNSHAYRRASIRFRTFSTRVATACRMFIHTRIRLADVSFERALL